MQRTFAVCTLLLFAPLAALHAAETKSAGKPNVNFILTDDQGWNNAHFAGHPQNHKRRTCNQIDGNPGTFSGRVRECQNPVD